LKKQYSKNYTFFLFIFIKKKKRLYEGKRERCFVLLFLGRRIFFVCVLSSAERDAGPQTDFARMKRIQ